MCVCLAERHLACLVYYSYYETGWHFVSGSINCSLHGRSYDVDRESIILIVVNGILRLLDVCRRHNNSVRSYRVCYETCVEDI